MYSLDWPYVCSTPDSVAQFKLTPEDFHVNEFFSAPFSAEGEHLLVRIEKRGMTTEEVVKSVARFINKPAKLISYAGLKDRQALATQWLSIHLPGEAISGVEHWAAPGWRVLEWTRHNKKLKPGFLAGNHFVIRLHQVSNMQDLETRIERIKHTGVPNYFGEQRFGREAGNLTSAQALLVEGRKVKDRFLKGLYCSAARSWLFNLILAQRVINGTWNKIIPGDVLQLSGSNSIFVANEIDEALILRIADRDISPASPLPGRAKKMVRGEALDIMNQIYEQWAPWLAGLEKQGLEEAWRANILHVGDFKHRIEGDSVTLSFTLPAGAYATVVLRELVHYSSLQ